MVRRKTPKNAVAEHTLVTLRVDRYELSVEAAVNPDVANPQYAFRPPRDNDPLLRCVIALILFGTATDPPERAGNRYQLTLRGTNSGSGITTGTLGDIRTRDEHGTPRYRKSR